MKIVIDAGHWDNPKTPGIEDPGAIAGALTEQKLALQVRDELKGLLKDYDVQYVADSLSLKSVIKWIKDIIFSNDLAITIHFNASKYEEARGTECYYAIKKQKDIAEIMSENVSDRLGVPNRGAKHDSKTYVKSLGFLRKFTAKSVLLECCYLTNVMDKVALNNNGIHKIALGIKDTIDIVIKKEMLKRQIFIIKKLVELLTKLLKLKSKKL
jgi:N-acetylmuramoyl-L-alanine amidase